MCDNNSDGAISDPDTPQDGSEQDCDAVSVDQPGECQPDPDKPCPGNPVKNPRIAPQTNSGVDGGRFGPTRTYEDGTPKEHKGLDIANDVGDSIFSMYSGRVVRMNKNTEHKDLGWYVTVQSKVDGKWHVITFAHLQKEGRPANDSSVNAGEILGKQGTSGNLKNAIKKDLAEPHTHIILRERTGSGWTLKNDFGEKIDPEKVIKTKFDEQGNPVSGTDC